MISSLTEQLKKEKQTQLKIIKDKLHILRSMISDADENNERNSKPAVLNYKIPFNFLMELDAVDVVFYMTRFEEFYKRDFFNLEEEQKEALLAKATSKEVLEKETVDYLSWLFSLYASFMTDEQLLNLTKAILKKAHENFALYRILSSKLFELGKLDILEIVLIDIEEKFGKNASKEIKENLIK